MPKFGIEFSIDGQEYSHEQIARIIYDRHIHGLHEMKRHGAALKYNGKSLSHDDINLLNAEDARDLSVGLRESYGAEGARELFKEQLRGSDRMWKDIASASAGASPRLASADLTVTGISLDEFQNAISLDTFHRNYPKINPDHYYLNEIENGIQSMEVFGMHGGNAEVQLIIDPETSVPFETEPDYPIIVSGYTLLASDSTNIGILAAHQYKPLDNGMALKLGCVFPSKTPKEIVDGHKLHMAIEFWGLVKIAETA